MLPDVAHRRPTTVSQAVEMLGDDAVAYAGGTELVPAMRLGLRQPATLVSLKGIPDLAGIDVAEDGSLLVGARTTHRQLAAHPEALRLAPLLAEAARHVGNVRVRTTGTVGGNLAFAEPRSDLATVCVALDAKVDVARPGGQRRLRVDELIVGAYATALEPDEILVRLRVRPQQEPRARYWKLQLMERPTVGVAVVPHDRAALVVVGAATECPVRAELPFGDPSAVKHFCGSLELTDDLAGSADYKRHVLAGHLVSSLATQEAA